MNNKISIGIGIMAIALIFSLWYVTSSNKSVDVFAKVNGEEITKDQVEETKKQLAAQQGVDIGTLAADTQKELNTQVIDMLIDQAVITQKIAGQNIEISQEQIDAQIELIKQQFESSEEFESVLELEGVSLDDLRERVYQSIAVELYLEQELNLSSIEATPEEIDALRTQFSEFEDFEELQAGFDFSEYVIQQKQQQLIDDFISKIRNESQIEIFI